MNLTDKAQVTVNRLRVHAVALTDDGFTAQNATERVLHDNGHVTTDLVFFALGMPYDRDALKRGGHVA